MRKLIEGQPGQEYWLVFRTRSARDEAKRRFARRGWYTLTWQDVAGPALEASRVWYTAPPGTPDRERRHRRVGV